jgi:hypothetical protein
VDFCRSDIGMGSYSRSFVGRTAVTAIRDKSLLLLLLANALVWGVILYREAGIR